MGNALGDRYGFRDCPLASCAYVCRRTSALIMQRISQFPGKSRARAQIRRAYSAINNYKALWPPSCRDCSHISWGYIALNKDMKYSCRGESTALVNFTGQEKGEYKVLSLNLITSNRARAVDSQQCVQSSRKFKISALRLQKPACFRHSVVNPTYLL